MLAAPLNIFNENIANSYDLVDCKGKYQFIYTLLKLKPECISPFSSVLLAFAQNSDLSLIIDLPGILYGFNDKKICLNSFSEIIEFTRELRGECSQLAGYIDKMVTIEKEHPTISIPERTEVSETEPFVYHQRSLFDRLIAGNRQLILRALFNIAGTCVFGGGFAGVIMLITL